MNNIKIKNKQISMAEIIETLKLTPLIDVECNKNVSSSNVYRVGYEFIGFFQQGLEELESYIHIIGKKEFGYLRVLEEDKRREILRKYFLYPFPAIVVSQDCEITEEFLQMAKRYRKPILKSSLKTTETIRDLKYLLQKKLAEEVIIEGYIFLEIYGVGVMLTGYEEAKLGVTIELLERGHKLITDENLIVKRTAVNELKGYNRLNKKLKDSHFFLLNKDNSKIDITNHFGVKATRSEKRVDLIINLEKWNEKKFYDRLGLDEVYEKILNINISKLTLPVKRGRNLAVIVEAGAMNHRLKNMGVNSAKYFWEESQKIIKNNKLRKENMSLNPQVGLPIKEMINKFKLEIISGKEYVGEKYITTTSLHRPSLALSGYYDMYEEEGYKGIQVFSEIEFNFLDKLNEEERRKNVEKYLEYDFPLIILTSKVVIPEYFIDLIKEKKLVLVRSDLPKLTQIIALYNGYLEYYFAPSISVHGVFIELYGFGVLLIGKSGIGKSETALELIHRGHRLISDDLVKFTKDPAGDIIGKAATLPYFMEVRGLGIIDIKALYGLSAVRINKRLDAIVELKEANSEDYLTSVNYENREVKIMGKSFHKVELYISSGRNAAAMLEVAVMNLMAKKLGHDPEIAFREGMSRLTQEEKDILEL